MNLLQRCAHVWRLCAISAGALWVGMLFSAPGHAQTIDDVPMAVKNNAPPNFMFMIDNSGSMRNIVPTPPFDPGVTYEADCPSGAGIYLPTAADASGNRWISLRITGGVPYAQVWEMNPASGGTYPVSTTYRHTSLGGAGDRICFSDGATYRATLYNNMGAGPSEYTGRYLNWYFGDYDGHPTTGWVDRKRVNSGSVRTRLDIAKSSATTVINGLPLGGAQPAIRVGVSSFNVSDGGLLTTGVAGFNAAQRTAVLNGINNLTPTSNTPLAETLADIGRYFATGYSGDVSYTPVGGSTPVSTPIDTFLRQDGRNSCLAGANCQIGTTDAVPASPATGTPSRPIQYWCQSCVTFLMTDGRPHEDRAFTNNTHLRDFDGDCSGVNGANCVDGGNPSTSFDRKLSRVYERRGSDYLDDVAKALFDIDLRPNLPAPSGRPKRNNIRTYTIGFADMQVQNDPLLMSTAERGGGDFFNAENEAELTAAFNRAITDALARSGAAAAVAVANAQVTVNNTAYASSYTPGSWFGDLVAYPVNTTTGNRSGSDIWSFRERLAAQSPASRKIVSFNGSSGSAFTPANFAGSHPSLTAGVINYVRGDRTGEGGIYRARQDVLGDIINAEPVVVTYSDEVPVIFQGANDGMLHVIDGRTTGGQELWAYVPRLVHQNLANLSSPSYSHQYFVDGTPATAVVTGHSFSRLLVGGLGKGGRGYYALDISSYTGATEADVANKVLWEFGPANMGYSFGTPLIVNTAAGWRVVVASGYGNGTGVGDGVGRVWVLNPATGAIERTFNTAVGTASSPAGLAHLTAQPTTNASDPVRFVYGGDLLGNVWRFDLDTGSYVRIAALTDPSNTAQPITAPVAVAPSGTAGKVVVLVGTGRYLSDEDVPGTAAERPWATQRQSMYGLIDDITVASTTLPNLRGTNGPTCPDGGGNGDLVCQRLDYNPSSNSYRATSHSMDINTKRGWYLDLPTDTRMSYGRITGKPALAATAPITAFTVNIPTNVVCEPGGRSWFLALALLNGGDAPTRRSAIATSLDTVVDSAVFLGERLSSRVVLVRTLHGERGLMRMSDQTVESRSVFEPDPGSPSSGPGWRRIYWRTVK